jgi:DNA-binding NarL/FixJ family response regulator
MSGAERIRLLLVDDHAVVREGLCALFGRYTDIEVVGEAGDGATAIALYRACRPDVAIIDLRLPGTGGINVIRTIAGFEARARLLVLTSLEGDADVRAAMAAGASGFLLKGAGGDEILRAVREVHAGKQWIARDVRELLRHSSGARELSPREIEVLNLVVAGLRNQDIATRLGLALNTVKVHVQSVLLKLDATDRTEAAVTALKRGIMHL